MERAVLRELRLIKDLHQGLQLLSTPLLLHQVDLRLLVQDHLPTLLVFHRRQIIQVHPTMGRDLVHLVLRREHHHNSLVAPALPVLHLYLPVEVILTFHLPGNHLADLSMECLPEVRLGLAGIPWQDPLVLDILL